MAHRTTRPKSGLRWSNWGSSTSQTDVLSNETISIKAPRPSAARPTTAVIVKSEKSERAYADTTKSTGPKQRPGSAVRPLSGNIFMRRSSKRGWVAKAYPDQNSSFSQPNLELEPLAHSRLDSESLDSFFDDEFEDQDEAKLGLLLSCNTLGVESKRTKQDWISGEIDIPKFHCPRCRDHWYGIRSEPCDEELARLIREGLWKTGNAGSDLQQKGKHRAGSFTLTKSGDRDSLSTSSSGTKLPDLKHGRFHLKSSNSGSSHWEMKKPEEAGKQKKKKKITFQLSEDESGSGSQLDMDLDERSRGQGRRGQGGGGSGEDGGYDEVRGARQVSGAGGGSDRGREIQGGGAGGGALGSSGVDGSTGDDLEMARRRRNRAGTRGDEETASHGNKVQGSVGDESGGGKSSRRGKGSDLDGSQKGLELGGRSGDRSALGYGDSGSGTGHATGGSGDPRSWSGTGDLGNSGGREGGSGVGEFSSSRGRESEGESGSQQGEEGAGLGTGGGDGSGGSGGQGDRKQRNKPGSHSGTSQPATSGTGAGSTFSNPVDHGKKIRKSGGYMRAISPSSSEWGDPLHARSFLSSTATSRRGSSSNLEEEEGGDTDHNHRDSGSGRRLLPPIVQPITRPLPTLQMELMGPALTRPWTFSYH